ncbi:MAG: ABC transporter permease [Planctomycetia bacterium]
MALLIGSLTIGFLLATLAFGVFLSFRVMAFRDLTGDGSFTLGGAVCAVLLVAPWPAWFGPFAPVLATACGFLAGATAGAATGWLTTRFQIHGLLAGFLVMTGLHSVNLRVMGKSNISLGESPTLGSWIEALIEEEAGFDLLGRTVQTRELCLLAVSVVAAWAAWVLMLRLLRSEVGLALRAVGDNEAMARSIGVPTSRLVTAGLAFSNGLIGVAGALFVQHQGFVDVQMGTGMVAYGLASVIIGDALTTGKRRLPTLLAAAVFGSVLFRLLVAVALRLGLNPNDLKLVTAVTVLGALILPEFTGRLRLPWLAAKRKVSA